METCAICGKEAEHMPFTIRYDDTLQVWDLGVHICKDCAKQQLRDEATEEDKEDEESERFHAWADSQR